MARATGAPFPGIGLDALLAQNRPTLVPATLRVLDIAAGPGHDPRSTAGVSMLRRVGCTFMAGLGIIVALGVVDASTAFAAPQACKERERTQPAPVKAKNLLELQPNPARPTFNVELDNDLSGDDSISFPAKAGRRPGRNADVAAEFTDPPRYKGHPLKAKRFVAAHASKSGRSIVLYACFEGVPKWSAGRWEGTVALYGPRLSDFTYGVVVTTKWPAWVAIVTILVTVAFSLGVALATGVLKGPQKWPGYLRLFLTLAIALGLGALTFWSVYLSNETFGSTPNSDLVGLVSATFGAVLAGFATAKKLLSA